MKLMRWAAAAAGVALVVSGCGTTSEEAAKDTTADNADVCQSLGSLSATVDQVGAGAASAAATTADAVTVNEANDALSAIAAGWTDVKSSAADLSDSVATQMDMAISDYQKALGQVNGDDTLVSASAQVQTAQASLRQSYTEVMSQLGC